MLYLEDENYKNIEERLHATEITFNKTFVSSKKV